MSRPWMPMYWGNYLADTGHLSTVQHGAYLLLIGHYWMRGGLPADDQQLANITKLTLAEWMAHRPVLQMFFDEGWRHRRIDQEMRRTDELRAKRATSGHKGGTVASINRFRKH